MDAVEIVADNSMSGQESQVGVSSVGSYNDAVIVHNDSGSVTSGSAQGSAPGSAPAVPQSPARSTPSVPSSPGNTTQTPGAQPPPHGFQPQQPHGVDLLDTPDPFAQGFPTSRERSGFTSSDDDHTEPSSSATGNTAENPAGYTRSDLSSSATSTFGRFIESTKRRLSSVDRRRSNSDGDADDDDEEEVMKSALIYGYLQKLGRNGKWQARWFETDGECLTYYKSNKRIKLLATLDLAKVGSIVINHQDESESSFTINISERPYHLRADSKASCRDWVITLNRVKEARMQEGNVKLAIPTHQPQDLLDDTFTPRVVVVANRQRTRAVDDEEIQSWENAAAGWPNNPANESGTGYIAPSSNRLARWQKPRNSLSRLANKLMKWARSIRKYGCAEAENHVVLDHHLHPPGHDDKTKHHGSSPSRKKAGTKDVGPMKGPTPGNNLVGVGTSVPDDSQDDDDDDIRHLS